MIENNTNKINTNNIIENNNFDNSNSKIKENEIIKKTKMEMFDYQDKDDITDNESPKTPILERIESKMSELFSNTTKENFQHPCHKLGLSSNYLKNQQLKLKEYEKIQNVNSIKDSTFIQQYGDIHREDNKKECMHCEKEHKIKIYSSTETNNYVDLFQKEFIKIVHGKNSTMVGAAIVSLKDKVKKIYITHSGSAPEGIKEIYKNLGAKIIEYKPNHKKTTISKKINQRPLNVDNEKTDICEKDDQSLPLYAIHTDSALDIHEGDFKTLYGKKIESYHPKKFLENEQRENENKIKELEEENIEINNEISSLNEEKKDINLKLSPSNSSLEETDKTALKDRVIKIGKSRFNYMHLLNNNKKLIEKYKKEEKTNIKTKFSQKYGTNFSCCAAQKILQQISKDFGDKFHKKSYTITMSEAWIQKPEEKTETVWSQIHPVPSCETCAYVVPNMLCEDK